MSEERTITLEFKWTVSRGRDTYGYNICTLYADGSRVARCNGGGYDMEGTVLGSFIARNFSDRLLRLPGAPAEARTPCDRCNGAGKVVMGWARCETCYGRGILQVPDGMPGKDCEACGGEGLIYHDELVECRHCSGRGSNENTEGSFYGLTFHDPNYDPGKAVIGEAVHDRTLGTEAAGLTVAEAEARGVSIGLERYQAIYAASSRWHSERHTVPSIDGACGMSSVQAIGRAIGLQFQDMRTRSRNLSVILLTVGDDPHEK